MPDTARPGGLEPGTRGVDPTSSTAETTTQPAGARVRAYRTRHAMVYVDPDSRDGRTVGAYLQRPGQGFETERVELAVGTIPALEEVALWVREVPRHLSPAWVVDADEPNTKDTADGYGCRP